jgi:hypothetical protein
MSPVSGLEYVEAQKAYELKVQRVLVSSTLGAQPR